MKKGIKIVCYIFRHILIRPTYLYTYVKNYLNSGYIPKVDYYDTSELVTALKAGKSLIRIGDGEIYIMNGGSISYQKFSRRLQKALLSMVKNYSKNSPYLLGLNKIPISKSNVQLKKDNLLRCWLPMKVYWHLYFNITTYYFDATAFYFNETIPKYLEAYLKTKHLILVSRAENILKFQNNHNIPFTDVSFIEAPEHNSFSVYDELKDKIRDEVYKYGKADSIVLMAFGPACKPMAFELANEEVVTIDVGRGIEVAYTNERIDHIIYPGM